MIRQYSLEGRPDYIQFINPDGVNSAIVGGRIIRRHFGVGSLVRIPQIEYPSTLKAGESVFHINLPIHDGHLEELVLLCEIIQTGSIDHNGKEVSRPLLSFANAYLAKTTLYYSSISQDKALGHRTGSLIALNETETIPEILHRRYRRVCNLSPEEAGSTNVALRQFTIIETISPSSLNSLNGKIRGS